MRPFFLVFVFALFRSAFGNTPRIKNCDDCTSVSNCEAASILILKYESEADDQLKKAFCGFDDDKPKVCCSMLSNAEPTIPTPGSDSLEDHPNLRLLPQNCSEMMMMKHLGGRAELYEYPWMALIAYKTKAGLQFQCSGSVINERYVLTAAHCLTTQIAGVRIGEFDFSTEIDCQGVEPSEVCESHIQDLRIEAAIPHPAYQGKPSFKNDIGLIRLKKPVDLTFKNAKTICLPVTKALQDRNVSGLQATITGWAFTESGYRSSRLQVLGVALHSKDNCSAAFNEHIKRPEDSIDFNDKLCAGGYDTDNVDGGPLMVRGSHNGLYRLIQHGVFSFGSGVRAPGVTTVYTDISKYMKWILNTMKP